MPLSLVIMEIGSLRVIHFDVTDHPVSEWTLQQLRETIQDEKAIRFLIHDRDSIYCADLDLALEGMGLKILKTPVTAPQANAYSERMLGIIRREFWIS